MKTKIFRDVPTQARLELGPLHPFLDDFCVEMKKSGYPEHYLRETFRIILRLSDWVGLKQIPLDNLTEEKIKEFWIFHATQRDDHHDITRLAHLLQFFRNRGIIPKKPEMEITCPVEKLLAKFDIYLREEKGLSEIYIYQQLRASRRFLREAFPEAESRWELLTAQIIGDHLSQLLRKIGPSEARDAARYLVQFFKYLYIKGKTKIDFSKVVPRPANWRHTRLPIYIEPDKVEKLLGSCDRKTQIGARDYAILLILARLGLRGCEVKNLNLEDIHWREGSITVRGKGQESKMPLPKEVGGKSSKYPALTG